MNWWKLGGEEHIPTREDWEAAFANFRKLCNQPLPPPPFVGLTGVGCVCYSEYRDIRDRTGPYAKGGPLDLGDKFYEAK